MYSAYCRSQIHVNIAPNFIDFQISLRANGMEYEAALTN